MIAARQAHQAIEGEDRVVEVGVGVGQRRGILLLDAVLPAFVVVGQDRAGEADHDRREVRGHDAMVAGLSESEHHASAAAAEVEHPG